ncbi:hypothetical protein CR513_13403, partial [Mucuna pruriens]
MLSIRLWLNIAATIDDRRKKLSPHSMNHTLHRTYINHGRNPYQTRGHDCVTPRSSFSSLHPLDPDIDRMLNRLRKTKNINVGSSSSLNSISKSNNFESKPDIADSQSYKPEQIENNNRMLKELATLDYPQLEPTQSYKLKSRLVHLLPKFHGLAGGRSTQAPKGVPRGLFHNEAARDTGRLHQDEGVPFLPRWSSKGLALPTASHVQHMGRYEAHVLGEILPGIQNCDHPKGNLWDQATYRREISRILGAVQQAMCNISEQLLLQYFYEGLMMMDRNMIDAASEGVLMYKTPAAARHLIFNMASNT